MSSPFRFKQFSISQEYSPMKVGTDSVLLGAWTPAINPTYILDIGAGTGVLSLMMAQRSLPYPCGRASPSIGQGM